MSAECLPACLPERATTRRGNFATVKWGFKGERIAGRREREEGDTRYSMFFTVFESC